MQCPYSQWLHENASILTYMYMYAHVINAHGNRLFFITKCIVDSIKVNNTCVFEMYANVPRKLCNCYISCKKIRGKCASAAKNWGTGKNGVPIASVQS